MQLYKFMRIWTAVWLLALATFWSSWLAYKWWHRVLTRAEAIGYWKGYDEGLDSVAEEQKP